MQSIKVSLVFITFNNEGIIRKSIGSFIKFVGKYIDEIIVFDNASVDRTVEEVKSINCHKIKIFKSHENLGYRRALNIVINIATNELIIVSNPDVYLIDNSLEYLINTVNNDKKIGLGCPIPLTQKRLAERPIISCILYKTKSINELRDINAVIETQVGGGSIFIIRKNVFKEIGGLSEECFMYGEEIEMSYKILNRGYKIIWDTRARVIHEHGYSTRRVKDDLLKDKIISSFYCSLLNCYKHVYKDRIIFHKILFFVLYFLFVIFRATYKLSLNDLKKGISIVLGILGKPN
ncbi:glycosyltransferase family 2 protein [Saccharolobus shibatae]|uniref:Glycosyltransferase 2-like domain-containing protein n=1 Tax=Saccharolobus shibatae TaxID=2286 RepID=A0A8F5C0T8_9CREN|nr:glycosyltransferase family 2 protein [Saccharolobus shibatae]QXJ34881.1 hypothetical protein J5U22_01428 [Saccharolobus shibatae]